MPIQDFERYPLTLTATGSRVLYAHLGGQPALNAYRAIFDR